jgi:PKD repeat protein
MVGPVAVSLTVTDSSGLSASETAAGTIAPGMPVADAGGPYVGTAATPLSFSGSGTDPQAETLTYAWNFGDGSAPMSGANTNHSYQVPGTYTVSVTVTDTSHLSATATFNTIIAAAAPVANAGGPYAGTAETPIVFIGSKSYDPQGETLNYAWNFGDSSPGSTGVSPGHTYAQPGSYILSLTVIDASGLSATATAQVIVAAVAPVANAGGPYMGTTGTPIALNGSGSTDPQSEALSYSWNFGDGGTADTGSSPSHTYAQPGSYVISLTVTNSSGLSGTATAQATIGNPPIENTVMAGSQPVSNSFVQLYAVGTGGTAGTIPVLNASVVTDQVGRFSISGKYTCPSPDSQMYLTATGGNLGLAAGTNNTAISLMTTLGSCASLLAASTGFTVNEVSTVVSVWPASTYMSSSLSFVTTDPRIVSNAFVDSTSLASIISGAPSYPGLVIPNQDLAIRSLANSLNACVSSNGDSSAGSACGQLFAAATPAGGSVPTDTLSAAWNIALNPTSSVPAIFFLASSNFPFGPALAASPTDWALGLPRPTPVTFNPSLNASTVFMGDSITYYWQLLINNSGIAGQRTSDMLARFATDVLGHGYARVVILAGTNDIWSPIAVSGQAVQQIGAMAQMARAAGIEVVLCELPPMLNNPGYYGPLQISFNASLADFARTNGYLLVDYYTPMAGHPEYFLDGVHPNTIGYVVMEAALSSVVEQ